MTRLSFAVFAAFVLCAPLAAVAQQSATGEVIKPVKPEEAEAPAGDPAAAPAESGEAPAGDAAAGEAPAGQPEAAEAPASTEAPAAQEKPEVVPVEPRPASAEPREVIKETFGDWDIVCAPDNTACIMAQKGADPEGREIMEVRVRRLKEQTRNNVKIVAAIQIAVPIGVMLQPGVALQIDSGKKLPAAYRTCNPTACIVQEAVDAGLVASMKKGAKAVFTIVAPPKIEIPVPISLKGFTAAYNSLEP